MFHQGKVGSENDPPKRGGSFSMPRRRSRLLKIPVVTGSAGPGPPFEVWRRLKALDAASQTTRPVWNPGRVTAERAQAVMALEKKGPAAAGPEP
jgi:hypothetical protein